MRTNIVDKTAQDNLNADLVLTDLMDGNGRYVKGENTAVDYNEQRNQTAGGQWPKAIILSCIDSRVPTETIFDQSIGDVFVARVAGNVESTDVIASMEYACKVAGSKLIMVLGHTQCGAVKAACDGVELGNITALLSKVKPAIAASTVEGTKDSSNGSFVHDVIGKNAGLTIERIKEKSPILKEMADNGEIKFVSAVYDIETGIVETV
jgi:carbonic anhydrase